MVGYWKGKGIIDAGTSRNVRYVRLHGSGFDVLVTGEDWVKIIPYLQDGTLGPAFFASPSIGLMDPTKYVTGRDFGDPTLYQRTFTTLSLIFADAEAYPRQVVQQGFTPSLLPGMVAQFDASFPHAVSLVGTEVSLWSELAQGMSASQPTPGVRPTFNPTALNGLPGIEFDGTQWLDLPLQALQNWTVLVVGAYQESATQVIGGMLVAAGYEGLGSGVDCYIKQSDSPSFLPGPKGRLATWLQGDLAAISPYNNAAAPDTFKLFSWSQASQLSGSSYGRIGVGQNVDFLSLMAVTPYDLTQEGWDPARQLAGNPAPLMGALGRYSGPLGGGPRFYLEGTLCEVLVYNRILTGAEFDQVAVSLNTKWGGTLL